MNRRWIAIVLTAAALLVACSSPAGQTSEPTSTTSAAREIPTSIDNGKIRTVVADSLTVCAEPHPAFIQRQDDTNNWTGYEIDILMELAKNLDRKLVVVETTTPTIWAEPDRQVCDIAAGRILITNQRRQQAIFSTPYFTADQALVRSVDSSSTFLSLEDLENERIGAISGSAGQRITTAKVRDPVLRTYPTPEELLTAVQTDQVEVAVIDEFELSNLPDDLYVAGLLQSNEEYGLALGRESKALLKAVNETLMNLESNGTSEQFYNKWLAQQQGDVNNE